MVVNFYHFPIGNAYPRIRHSTPYKPPLGRIEKHESYNKSLTKGTKEKWITYEFLSSSSYLYGLLDCEKRCVLELKRLGCEHLDDEHYKWGPDMGRGLSFTMKAEYEAWFLKEVHVIMNPWTLSRKTVFFNPGKEVRYWRCITPVGHAKADTCLAKLEQEKYPGGSTTGFINSDYFQSKYKLIDYHGYPLGEKEIIWILKETNLHRVHIEQIKKGSIIYVPFLRK
ncbi:MAG: hypothetical protein AAF518_20510 [Spirochaetota bacterium]